MRRGWLRTRLLLGLIVAAMSASAEAQHARSSLAAGLPASSRIMFNLQDATLFDLVRAISNITGRHFVLGGRLRDARFTIYGPTPVTPAEAYQAFLSALATNGMTVVSSGRYLVIIETDGAVTRPLPLYGAGERK